MQTVDRLLFPMGMINLVLTLPLVPHNANLVFFNLFELFNLAIMEHVNIHLKKVKRLITYYTIKRALNSSLEVLSLKRKQN